MRFILTQSNPIYHIHVMSLHLILISVAIAFCFLVFLLYFIWQSFGNVRVQQVVCYGTSILVLLDISHWAGLVCINCSGRCVSVVQQAKPLIFVISDSFLEQTFDYFNSGWYGDYVTCWNSHCVVKSVNSPLVNWGPLSETRT